MTPMPTPMIDTSALVSELFNDGSGIWVLLFLLSIISLAFMALQRMRTALNEWEPTEAHKHHLIKRLSDDTWEYVGEYQPTPEDEKPKHQADETPVYMTIGDDGELVEMKDE